jgi:ketosteroid isomerase-like protein
MNPRLQRMKGQLSALMLVLSMAAASAATQPAGPQSARSTDARQELLALEEQWTVAEEKHDAAALGRILDDRFVATFGAARTYDKEAFIRVFSGEVDVTASHALTYEAVIIDGDTAVLIGIDTARGTRDGAAYTAVYRYTTTYIRRGDRWLALAEHIVRAPQ